jgi:transporter family-2 protein
MIAGISFVIQQAVNSDLRLTLHSAAWAGFVSYLGGMFCMLVLALGMNEPVPTSMVIARSHWWAWTGGLFGAIYIAVSILLLPRLGAAAFVAFLIAGQMLSSVAFDRFGILGLAQRPADPFRLFGVVLLIAGATLVLR